MEHKIGEIVTLPDGRKAKVEKAIGCYGCVYENESVRICANLGSSCSDIFRTDGKNIIYKEIKE